MLLHADTLAEAASNLERSKKISWFAAVGDKEPNEADLSHLLQTREDDRTQATNLRAAEDSSRRIAAVHSHMAPLDSKLRNIFNTGNDMNNNNATTKTGDDDDVLATYPLPPKSSFDPAHPEASSFKWAPNPSDFFPNTKTMIDSRKGALQQFKQLCYFTLLRKRVESRLETLQRERGFQLVVANSNNNNSNVSSSIVIANNAPNSPTNANSSSDGTSSFVRSKTSESRNKNNSNENSKNQRADFIILGDVYDPLPNPSTTSQFTLSREMKNQVELKLLEAAAKLEGRDFNSANMNSSLLFSSSLLFQQQQNNNNNKNNNSSSGANNNNARSTSKGRTQSNDPGNAAATSSKKKPTAADAKKQQLQQQLQQQQDQQDDKTRQSQQQQQQNADDAKSSRIATFAVSSNLQLLQPLRISDMEIHPEMTLRTPFAFRAQRYLHLPFPRHDFVVSGPKNALLNFPAGINEVSEAPLTNPAQVVLEALNENSQFTAALAVINNLNSNNNSNLNTSTRNAASMKQQQQQRSGSAGKNRASPNKNQQRPQSAGVAVAKRKRSPALTARNVPSSFIFPQVSVETFEPPSVTTSHKIAVNPLVLGNGVGALSGVTDFPAGHYTRVASAPLEAARPSPVPPRHKRLGLAAMGFFFSSLPRTLENAQSDDDLSDDEDHDVANVGNRDHDDSHSSQHQHNNNNNNNNALSANHHAATFLTTPPLSLDEASVSKLFLPVNNNNKNNKTVSISTGTNQKSSQQQQGGGRPGSSPSSKRPPSPSTRGVENSNSGDQQQQQQQQQQASVVGNENNNHNTAEARLAWTSQPVHNEDIFDVNERVQNVLQNSLENSEKRRKMIPSFLQHLV